MGNFGSVPPTVLLTPSRLPLRTVVHCKLACYGEFRDGALEPRILSAHFDCCEREEEHPSCGTRSPSLSIKFVAFCRSEPLSRAGSNGEIHIGMYKIKIISFVLLILVAAKSLFAQSATVNWTTEHQTIDGFGAACSGLSACDGMTAAQGQAAFDPVNGIGLSLFRDILPGDESCATTCTFISPVPVQYALSYGARVWSGALSPPASMKSNGSTICNTGSGNGSLLADSYAAYATYLKNYTTQFQARFGAPLYGISVQNEPDFCPKTYDGAVWTGTQIQTFVKNNLGPAMAGTGVKIMLPEMSWWNNMTSNPSNEADPCMTDSACAAYVGVVAGHDYTKQNQGFGAPDIGPYAHLGSAAHLWETETSLLTCCFDGSMADALYWAQNIHTFMTVANLNAWHYWRLYNSQSTNDNEALIQGDGTIAKRFYVVGNWSKFVRPGWVRIGATSNPQAGIYVTAFKDPLTGKFAIVAINQNTTSVNMDFSLSGFPSVTTVTPTLTSASADLVDQVEATLPGGSFSYALPASSVVTFHGTASLSSSKAPAAPSNLTVIVH